ncbi:MAG: hypothetical protein QNJ64_16020 [Crocosphaera sp.]|nr:hypothetical protein [Crocosphaera sp.]
MLVYRNNQWDKQVYGDGIQGEIINSRSKDNTYKLTLKIQTFPTILSDRRVETNYQLTLIHNQTKLEGTFTGNYNKQSVFSRAIAYVHRHVATVRYSTNIWEH